MDNIFSIWLLISLNFLFKSSYEFINISYNFSHFLMCHL